MVRELIGLWGAAAGRCLHGSLVGVATFTAVALFAAVSLAFTTLAGYDYFRASEGPVAAALIVAAAYGLSAIAIHAIAVWRRRAARLRRAAAAQTAAANADLLGESATASETSQEELAWMAAVQLGRQLPPFQLLALSLAAGFMAGKKLRR